MVQNIIKEKNFDNKEVKIFVEDEGRFGRITSIGHAWAAKNNRPKSFSQIIREYIYAYSAVCPSTGEISSLILPYANSECMNIFLKHLSEEFKEYFIVLQIDGAGWHKSKDLSIPSNIGLLYQPPYSPELNPVEHIWDEIREKNFTNKIFNSIEQVIDKLSDALMSLSNDKSKVKSMCNFPLYNCMY